MTPTAKVIDVSEKLSLFSEPWHPKIVAELNGQYVKLARLKGEFVWHLHETEDELFWVISGTLVIRLRDGEVTIRPGQFAVIPMGVEHLPVAAEEVAVMLLEPKTTLNTGNINNERTVEVEWI